jgi:hypothetical protein
MNIAAIINVAPGQAALSQATRTQALLLDRLGSQLGSIRLAVPRLLKPACLGALAEKPDLLVVAGGPRAARRAGQIAYAHRLPILFLPGYRSASWARRLWGSLSLEDMVTALADGAVTPLRLPAGFAAGHIFFGAAFCGGLPHIRQLRADLAEVETVAGAAKLLAETVAACGRVLRPRIALRYDGEQREASAVMVGSQESESRNGDLAPLGSFDCRMWRQGAWALARASVYAAAGRDGKGRDEPESFRCTMMHLRAGARTWLLLDGDAMALGSPVELRYLPRTVKTFAFASPALLRPRTRQGTTVASPTFASTSRWESEARAKEV